MTARCHRCRWTTPSGMPGYLDVIALADHRDHHCPLAEPDEPAGRSTAAATS